MLKQCCNVKFGAGIVLGMPASGRHSHKGQRGKKRSQSLLTYCEFQPVFCSQRCCQFIRVKLNLNEANRWPVQKAVWFFLSVAAKIPPAPAPLPNLQAFAKRTKNYSNAHLRSQNGGVVAEICLCRKLSETIWLVWG